MQQQSKGGGASDVCLLYQKQQSFFLNTQNSQVQFGWHMKLIIPQLFIGGYVATAMRGTPNLVEQRLTSSPFKVNGEHFQQASEWDVKCVGFDVATGI